jgi:hypothetical protein
LKWFNSLFDPKDKLKALEAEYQQYYDFLYSLGDRKEGLMGNAQGYDATVEKLKELRAEMVAIKKEMAEQPTNGVKAAVDYWAASIDYITKNAMPAALSAAGILGQAIGQTAAGSAEAWKNAAQAMLISILDFAEKAIQANLLVAISKGIWDPGSIAMAIGATVGIEALKGGISQSMSNNTSTASQSASTASSGASTAVSTSPTVASPAPSASGGGGNTVINIMSPVFMGDNSIIDFFNKAKTLGFIVNKQTYSMASGV